MTFGNRLCGKIIFSIDVTIVQRFITVLKRFLRLCMNRQPNGIVANKQKTNNGPLLKERPNVMKYIDFVFFLKEVECLHPKGAKNLISFLITRFYEMLIAFRLLTNGEDYQMYGNIDIYNAAPNIFIFY